MWHYILLPFDSQRLSAHFFINIRLPGPRASIDSRWPSSSDSTLMFQKKGSILDKTVTDKCISANHMRIHQLKGDRPTFINNNINAEQA